MQRKEWITIMDKIAFPVLSRLSEEKLHLELPTDFHPKRKKFGMLEAFGRTVSGLAPWIELREITDLEEKSLQNYYREMIITSFEHATNPTSSDYMNFSELGQPLVDTAFMAHFIVRAPIFSKNHFKDGLRENIISALKTTRKNIPPNMNWNLFSAMVEGALYVLGAEYDLLRVIYAIRLLDDWYLGDGIYGDGPGFHFDYYNSFVIQPMAIDLLELFSDQSPELKKYQKKMIPRFIRYAAIQERMISPDGSYPIIGRSIIYRFGAFQALAQAALQEKIPKEISKAQVRCALSAVIKKVINSEQLFDKEGWLQPGVYGRQPDLAEEYISIGSLYLTTAVFLPLGLSETHDFWTSDDEDWTNKKVWTGQQVLLDSSLE